MVAGIHSIPVSIAFCRMYGLVVIASVATSKVHPSIPIVVWILQNLINRNESKISADIFSYSYKKTQSKSLI